MASMQTLEVASRSTVRTVYDGLDAVFTTCGICDLTDGIYQTGVDVSYEQAQRNQRVWLLDRVGCVSGMRILDIGCGYGTLLAEAEKRGAEAIGITLSAKQAQHCRRQGLAVEVVDYRSVPEDWHGRFDCVVANGSVEHFVQPADAVAGRQNDIYREFFKICHCLLDPLSSAKRVATTIVHFDRVRPEPADLIRRPSAFPKGSDAFHCSLLLERVLGCYYPVDDQLERCAAPFFTLVEAVNGTEDYRRTSEEWLRMIRRSFLWPHRLVMIAGRLFPFLFTAPTHVAVVLALLWTESWQWQFRGEHPPMKLWRHIWQCV